METAVESSAKETVENASPVNKPEEKTPTPTRQDPHKKNRKDNKTKKDDKSLENFMKSLNSIPTLEEKLARVCEMYVHAADDNKTLRFYTNQSDKRYALLVKEKDQLQHEFNKTILVKSKLENLCRELQKQNKAIKEESLLKIREEEERRKETQAKFQSTLSEITTLLQQNNEKNTKLRDDNISMSEKFKSVVQQYQLREQQVEKMAKQMALESQLSDAKMQKASLEHQAEKERHAVEVEHLKMCSAQYQAKILELTSIDTSLRSQLAVYMEKYDEFQNALVKSNQVFGGFKGEMEKMSKKILKLEKESLSWKKRWETSQTALLDMCGERQSSEERAAAVGRQLLQMQGLCRTLQAERTLLLNTLKEHDIERPPLPAPTPAPPATPAAPSNNNDKVDAMAANCVQLRQSLAHLQNQLNVLTNKNGQTKEELDVKEVKKPEKQKKSKSKKNKAEKTQEITQEEEVAENVETKDTDDKTEAATAQSVETNPVDSLIDEIKNTKIEEAEVEQSKVEVEVPVLKEETLLKTTALLKDVTASIESVAAPIENEITNGKVEELETSLIDNRNEELAHIDEIKPISKEVAKTES